MVKSEFVTALFEKSDKLSKHEINYAVGFILSYVSETLIGLGRVEVRDFGSFSVRSRKPRAAHNPRTLRQLGVPEKKVVYFKPGIQLKQRVAQSRQLATISSKKEM
jgi:integration host factor subunit beta